MVVRPQCVSLLYRHEHRYLNTSFTVITRVPSFTQRCYQSARHHSPTSIAHLQSLYQTNALTPQQHIGEINTAILRTHKQLNCFITPTPTLATSSLSNSRPSSSSSSCSSLLSGVPIAIKDNIIVRDVLCTAGSRTLSEYRPTYNATVVDRLLHHGAAVVGKSNLDEFGMGSHNTTAIQGKCINPFSYAASRQQTDATSTLSSGGSSGGSAVAVAAGLCSASLGSDTGGSVRLPAAYCGVTALKPTYGRLSRYGLIAYASSFDTIGVIARTVDDVERVFRAVDGRDDNDSTSIAAHVIPRPDDTNEVASDQPLRGLTIGIPIEYHISQLQSAVVDHWYRTAEILRNAGARVVSVSLPHTQLALAAYYVLAPAEASSNLSRYDGIRYGHTQHTAETSASASSSFPSFSSLTELYTTNRTQSFGEEVRRRILTGTFVLSSAAYQSYYLTAQRVRRIITDELRHIFLANNHSKQSDMIDALLLPTSATTAPTHSHILTRAQTNTVADYADDMFTVTANLSGIPAMNIPVGYDENKLPIGLQLMTAWNQEYLLFKIGKCLENRIKFSLPKFDI